MHTVSTLLPRTWWLLLPGLVVLGSCRTVRLAPGHQPNDETEYYVQASPQVELTKRILPDPIGGLGHSNDAQLRVMDIRLTNQYTVLYMTFDQARGQNGGSGATQISIDPKARLFARGGQETFAFVKAEGIRLTPDHIDVEAGQKVSFVLYFDRLRPGVDEFALFECEDTTTTTCWNVTDMRVDNPSAQ